MEEISIYINNLYNNFQFHLENNNRILFSGPYGIGKTYFLREFFAQKEDEYNVFHLFPVNYQVSHNEDIFELIKIDILNHILFKGWLFEDDEKEKISKALALQAYSISKTSAVFQNLLKIFTLGKSESVVEGISQLEEIGNNFNEYYKEINSNLSLSKVKDFMLQFESRKGSIYEFDNTSQLIFELLDNHKSKENSQRENKDTTDIPKLKNVLIIDDIDRIDPEHIFRILNVFSAHFDLHNEDENKFGFDKIIFVCDVHNIRNIFSSKYGVKTDFNGYINKFFSSRIYHFNNRDEIKKTIKKYINHTFQNKGVHNKFARIKDDIIQFLEYFIDSGTINIRHLKNLERFDFSNSRLSPNYDELVSILQYVELLKFLLCIFNNDKQKLRLAFSDINGASDFYLQRRKDRYLIHLVPLLDYQQYREFFDYNPRLKESDLIYRNKEVNISIKYSISCFSDTCYANVSEVGFYDTNAYKYNSSSTNSMDKKYTNSISLSDIFNLFIIAIDVIDKNGILE